MNDSPIPPGRPDRGQEASPSLPSGKRSISFETLAQGAKEVLIRHAGQTYRLRLTKNGKLILNK
jgi:hemin uptake protein HemP